MGGKKEKKETRSPGQVAAAKRKRAFATIVYPDSAPAGWQDALAELHMQALVSPLHDADMNPDGSPKKPHWHVLVMADSPKTSEFWDGVRELIGGVGGEDVKSKRGYARYLIHADNPEKAQYSAAEVKAFGGIEYQDLVRLPTDDLEMLKEVFNFIRVNDVGSLAELMDFAAAHEDGWFEMLANRKSYVVTQYIKTKRFGAPPAQQKEYVNPTTGELYK